MKKVLGLDIGSRYIKIAQIKQGDKGRKPVILKTVISPAPEDSVADGELRNKEVIAAKIKGLLAENRITASELYISINSINAVVRDFKLPVLKSNEIQAALEFELSQSFPGIIQTHTISNKVYSPPNAPVEGIAAFCPNKILDNYVGLAKLLGIPLKAIDINANSLTKAYNTLTAPAGKGTKVIVDIGYTSSQVNLIVDGRLIISRQVSGGMNGFDGLVSNRVGISQEQAERARLNNKYDVYGLDNEDIQGFTRIAFSAVEEQIRQTVDYYKYNISNESISGIVLAGGGSMFAELKEYFGSAFDIHVSELKLDIKDKANEPVSSVMMSAIGAAIKEQNALNDINLIPGLRELKAASGKTVKMTAAAVIIAAIALIGTAAYMYLYLKTGQYQTEEMLLQNDMAKYSGINDTKNKLKAEQDRIASLTAALEQYNKGTLSNTAIFDSISSIMPPAVFSVNYNFMNQQSISINGISQDRTSIADFIYNLKQVEGISDAIVSSISTRSGDDGNPIDFNFAIEIKLKG